MRALSAKDLLSVWESGASQVPLQRALTMLAFACPEASSDSLARLTIGQRDARLLALREMTFGFEVTGVTDCPECGEKIELSLNCSQIRSTTEAEPPDELVVQANGFEMRFRLPTSADLFAVKTEEELLERCLLSRVDDLTEDFAATVSEKMASADPMAEIHLVLDCPRCQHRWEAPFDIVAFLWREISAAARRLLREVHTLASAYGWTETEILALSPARRRIYLEIVNG
ncbi:MAG TPA: hypothetical protein VJ420_08645 [Candidatus Udaeobacter sp.]|nr:hypothetical protein [Candidatus Udaeobacter sp.]